MTIGVVRGVDLVPAAGALLAAGMGWVYVGVMRDQGNDPLAWVLVVLIVGAVAAAYGSVLAAPLRRPSLVIGAVLLFGLGLLAIFSIGLPILLAAALTVVGAARSAPRP